MVLQVERVGLLRVPRDLVDALAILGVFVG